MSNILGMAVHRDWRVERRYPKSPEDGDGQSAEVQVARWPAEFFRIIVHSGRNSLGSLKPGFVLSTGSSERKLAHDIAKAVSEGALGLDPEGDAP